MDDFDILNDSSSQEEGSLLDINRIKSAIWSRMWMIVMFGILAFVISVMLFKNEVPRYNVYVTLKTREFAPGSQHILNRARQIEIRSRTFAERVTAKMGLVLKVDDDSKVTKGSTGPFSEFYTSTNPTPGLYRVEIDQLDQYHLYLIKDGSTVHLDSTNVWDVITSPRSVNGLTFKLREEFAKRPRAASFEIQPFSNAVKNLMEKIKLDLSDAGDFMTITMSGTDPDFLPQQLNKIADVYVEETLSLKKRDTSSYRQELEKRLAAAEENVNRANIALKNFYQRNPLNLDEEKSKLLGTFRESERMLVDLPLQQQKLAQLIEKLNEINGDADETTRRYVVRQIASFPAMSDESVFNIMKQTLFAQEESYDLLIKQYPRTHPSIQELHDKIFDTQNKIISFAKSYLDTLAQRDTKYKAAYKDVQQELKKLPSDQIQLVELERNKRINEDMYSFYYSEMQKLIVSELSVNDKDDIEILDRAIKPTSPVGGKKKLKIIFGSLLGGFFGVILSIGLEMANKKIRFIKDLEDHLKMPVLGAIPKADFKDIPEHNDYEKIKQMTSQLSSYAHSTSPIAESYRALRTNLLFSKKPGSIQTLLVTSIAPEEGKSFTSSNLAIIFAKQQKRTLLIDADFRRGVLHNSFGKKKEPGFANYLTNSLYLSEIVQDTYIPNLYLISCGSLVVNPDEILGSIRFKKFLDEARRKFDFIIIDAPPLNVATDAVIVSTQVDAVVIVIRANKTNRNEAKERLDVFKTVPANLIGVVLNGADAKPGRDYYCYSNY
jgi:succinoglycan biosynthesis transport protein ExoP